jgi:hypothetical protein
VNAIFPNFGCLQEGIAVAEALRRVLDLVAAPFPGEHVSIADCAGRILQKAFVLDTCRGQHGAPLLLALLRTRKLVHFLPGSLIWKRSSPPTQMRN